LTRPSPAGKGSDAGEALGTTRPHPSVAGPWALVKRTLDVTLALAVGFVTLPLLGLIACLVRVLDGSPSFFSQQRVGLDRHPFTLYKFRTMPNDAETGHPVWAVCRDPRCTRLGAVLRRSGLDELPQLWNVLRGEMSLVGPRPEREGFIREFESRIPGYADRHAVRPGITGYAQIHGWRGDTSIPERVDHDRYYIDRWSTRMDLRILLATPIRVWSERTRNGTAG
jgi:lipopolysaccharide/colanic/teichoic acid biosynthesis glycosyltransferase